MGSGKQTRPLQVGLLWHTFNHGNLGVDALARGHANLIRRAAAKIGVAVRFTAFGSRGNDRADLPADVTIGPGPQLKDLPRGKLDFFRALRSCDIVFDIGEGDSFTDIYGLRRCARQLYAKLAVFASGKPLVLAPQTIGPFGHAVSRLAAVAVMRRAAAVFTRDRLSTKLVEENGIKNVGEFIDVAFALPFAREEKAHDRVRVCINVSGLLYNGGYTGRNELGMALDYRALTHALIDSLTKRAGVEIHLLAHVHGSGGPDDDAPVMDELATRYPGLIMAPLFATSEQAKSYLSGMDFVVAGRMHASIGAFSAGVPVVPIAYSRKFNGLFDTLGYPHYVDGKAETGDAALAKVMAALDARNALASDIEQGLRLADIRLADYQGRLVRILQDISSFAREATPSRHPAASFGKGRLGGA